MTRTELSKLIRAALTPPEGEEDPNKIQQLIADSLARAIVDYVKSPEG